MTDAQILAAYRTHFELLDDYNHLQTEIAKIYDDTVSQPLRVRMWDLRQQLNRIASILGQELSARTLSDLPTLDDGLGNL